MHTLNHKAQSLRHFSLGMWAWASTAVITCLPLLEAGLEVRAISLVLVTLLLILSLIDSRSHRLPNPLTASLMVAALIWVLHLPYEYRFAHYVGGIMGYGLFWIVARTHLHLTHKHGLGMGDAKLLAAGGVWLGWQALAGVILIAATSALIWAFLTGRLDRGTAMPFGPFLALGIWWSWCHGPLLVGELL